MNIDILEMRLAYSPFSDGYSFVFMERNSHGKNKYVSKTIEMREIKDGEYIDPSGFLSQGAAQGLFDQLWTMGFRPKDGTGNSGHVAAIQYHLEDMRKLVFKGKQ